jgi:hypothetical protein
LVVAISIRVNIGPVRENFTMPKNKKSTRKPRFPRESEPEAAPDVTLADPQPTSKVPLIGDPVVVPAIRRASSSKWPWLEIPVAARDAEGKLVGSPFYVENTTTAQFSSQVAAAQRRLGTRYTVRQLPVEPGQAPRIGVWRIA